MVDDEAEICPVAFPFLRLVLRRCFTRRYQTSAWRAAPRCSDASHFLSAPGLSGTDWREEACIWSEL